MPCALTVILNSNHSKRFPLLLHSLADPKETILREARNKFRVKTLRHVFLQGGVILQSQEEIGEVTKTVWIGKGEPYNGPPSPNYSLTNRAEVRIIAEKSYIDEKAVKQLEMLAGLPGVKVAVGMPDLHPGSRFPIGCAVVADGIYPALIGSDVGCGIALYQLARPSRTHPAPSKLANLLRDLDDAWSGPVVDWLANYGISRTSSFDRSSLGTVGAGNHFAEICKVERIVDKDAAERIGIRDDALYLLVHSGSRGLGASILANETATESNPYIPPESTHIAEYLNEHDYAVNWAIANRDLIAHRIRQCVYNSFSSHEEWPRCTLPIDLEKIIDVTHNSVSKHTFHIGGESKELWVHRKGAAPSEMGIVPCPGSRGDYSWLLEPSGDGQFNAFSLAHGAGRRHARNVLHEMKYAKSKLTTTSLGSEVICTNSDLLLEERPEAYKAVGPVVEDLEDKGFCKGIVILRPLVTYKVRDIER